MHNNTTIIEEYQDNNIIFKCTGRDNPITTLTSKEANVIQGFLIQDRKMVF